MKIKKLPYYLLALSCTLIGLYSIIYFIIDRRFGLLRSKSTAILADTLWNTMFYTHIILGGIALLIGWLQFNKKLRLNNLKLHKKIGKVYIVSCLISGIAGFYISFYATGGLSNKFGFGSIFTTLFGFIAIKKAILLNIKN